MLNVTYKPFVLSIVRLNVVILSVVAPCIRRIEGKIGQSSSII